MTHSLGPRAWALSPLCLGIPQLPSIFPELRRSLPGTSLSPSPIPRSLAWKRHRNLPRKAPGRQLVWLWPPRSRHRGCSVVLSPTWGRTDGRGGASTHDTASLRRMQWSSGFTGDKEMQPLSSPRAPRRHSRGRWRVTGPGMRVAAGPCPPQGTPLVPS